MEFSRSNDLALLLRTHIDSFMKKVPISDKEAAHTWASLVKFLGERLADNNNRMLAIEGVGFTKTMHTILRQKRIDILVKALKEYNPEDYKGF